MTSPAPSGFRTCSDHFRPTADGGTTGRNAVLEFDSPAAAALCTAPALHLAASPPRMPPASIRERLPNIGAGHFNQLEVPDQVNAMIEAFLRHYV